MVKPTKSNLFSPLMLSMETNMSQVAFCSLTTSVFHVLTTPNIFTTLDTGQLLVSRSMASITLSLQLLQSAIILNGADSMKLWANNQIKFMTTLKLILKEFKENQVNIQVSWVQLNISLLMAPLFTEPMKEIQSLTHGKLLFTITLKDITEAFHQVSEVSWLLTALSITYIWQEVHTLSQFWEVISVLMDSLLATILKFKKCHLNISQLH